MYTEEKKIKDNSIVLVSRSESSECFNLFDILNSVPFHQVKHLSPKQTLIPLNIHLLISLSLLGEMVQGRGKYLLEN